MTGQQRRQQLLGIGRALFAERGFEGTSVEEIAATAGVSKPVVYEHFGGKEGLYAVVVDHEIQALLGVMAGALTTRASGRQILEIAALAFLDHIESDADGFRILVRDAPVTKPTGGMATLLSDVASRVEYILGAKFSDRGFDPQVAPLYAQMLVGMIAMTGQYWLDHREPDKAAVAAHVVNLAWNGLSGLETRPGLSGSPAGTAAEPLEPVPPALPTREGRHRDRARAAACAAHGRDTWEFDVLAALRRGGAPYQLSPGQLVAQTMVTSGTMTNRIDRLTGRGLVRRLPDPADGRGVMVRLESSGRVLVDGAMADLLRIEAAVLARLPSADRELLTRLLRELLTGLDTPGAG